MVILISFDIDGTLEVGDPPGVLTMEMVRRTQQKGFLIGSCSDRPISGQRAIWEQHNIPVDFAVSKHMFPDVKSKFEADVIRRVYRRVKAKRWQAQGSVPDQPWTSGSSAAMWSGVVLQQPPTICTPASIHRRAWSANSSGV